MWHWGKQRCAQRVTDFKTLNVVGCTPTPTVLAVVIGQDGAHKQRKKPHVQLGEHRWPFFAPTQNQTLLRVLVHSHHQGPLGQLCRKLVVTKGTPVHGLRGALVAPFRHCSKYTHSIKRGSVRFFPVPCTRQQRVQKFFAIVPQKTGNNAHKVPVILLKVVRTRTRLVVGVRYKQTTESIQP